MPAISTEVIASAGTDNIKNVSDRLASLGGAAVGASDDVAKAGGSFSNLSSTLKGFAPVAKGAGVAILAVAGAIGQSIGPAMRLEKQMAELAKLTGEEQAEPITASLMEMSNQMPIARERLMGVAESAARLGVRGVSNIREFTRVMGMVGTATNATAKSAAQDFARIAAMTQTPIEDIDKLASTANQLSNTAAASFQEVSDSARRSAAALSNLGASAPEVLALSTSLTEVSASARRSGTRLRRVAQQLQSVPAGELAQAFSDLSAEGIAQLKRNDPTDLILRMADAFRTGGKSAKILREILTSASEQALAGMAVSLKQVRTNLKNAEEEWNNANSLAEEYAQFQTTAAAKTQMLKNSIENNRATMGRDWLPVIKDVTIALRDMTSAATDAMTLEFEKVFPEQAAKEMTERLRDFIGERRDDFLTIRGPGFANRAESIAEDLQPLLQAMSGAQAQDFRTQMRQITETGIFRGEPVRNTQELASALQALAGEILAEGTEEQQQFATASQRMNKGLEELRKGLNLSRNELEPFKELVTAAENQLKAKELKAFSNTLLNAHENVNSASDALRLLKKSLKGMGVTLDTSMSRIETLVKGLTSLDKETREALSTEGKEAIVSVIQRYARGLLDASAASKILRRNTRLADEAINKLLGDTKREAEKKFPLIPASQILGDMEQVEAGMSALREQVTGTGQFTGMNRQEINERLRALEELRRARERLSLSSMQAQMDMIMRTAGDMADTMVTAFNALFDETKDAEEALQSFFTTLANNLAQRAIQSFLFSLIEGAFTGGGKGGSLLTPEKTNVGGSLFGPERKHGGPVSPGSIYPVGEAGPELFVPDTAGTIVPNDQLGGGGTMVKVDQNFQLSAIDERGMSEMIQRNKGMIARATIDAVSGSERASRRLNTRGRR